jgi:2'-5' RNA ligase
LVAAVQDAEPLVSRWRAQYDSSAAQGMPAHITLLYPFLPQRRLTDDVIARLHELCAHQPALEIVFRRTARFPEVLYLDPEPADGLRELTLTLASHWPEAPPYNGEFDEIVPHLTVAQGVGDDVLDMVEAEVSGSLPLAVRLDEAHLFVFDGVRWRAGARLPFTG